MSVLKFPHLFEPLIIRNTVFKNRIFASPQGSSYLDVDQLPTPEITVYYERKAIGGAATTCMGVRSVDYVSGLMRERYGVTDIRADYIGPVIGSHTGAGTLGIFFFGTKR